MLSDYLRGNAQFRSLIIMTVVSWTLFPVLLKFINPWAFKFAFMFVACVSLILCWKYQQVNKFELNKEQKLFFIFWAGYLLALTLATINANDRFAYQQLLIIFTKVLFFIFLISYIDKSFIKKTFSVYANIMVACVIAATVVAVAVAMGLLDPVATLRADLRYNFDIYWGCYYGITPVYAPFPLFRLQGFAEEPGTFAFSILPALYWFLVVKRAYFRFLILGIGLVGSLSWGAFLFVVLTLPVLWRGVGKYQRVALVVLIGAVLLYRYVGDIGGLYDLLFASQDSGHTLSFAAWQASQDSGHTSFGDRVDSIAHVLGYLIIHPIGTGSGLGMAAVSYPISVGFANAALESGVLGGVLYFLMFGLLSFFAVKQVWVPLDSMETERRIGMVVGLSVLSCVFMGLQRQQPDISYWHMWIYASFFYFLLKVKANPCLESRR